MLFVFAWYEGLHCIRPEIVVQLVNMEKGFVWFPTIACLSKTYPTDSEFHSGALVSVAKVAVDCFNHKFLFIMMGDFKRYCPRWVIVKRSQIMFFPIRMRKTEFFLSLLEFLWWKKLSFFPIKILIVRKTEFFPIWFSSFITTWKSMH